MLRAIRAGGGIRFSVLTLLLLSPPALAQHPCSGLSDCIENLKSSDSATQTGAIFILSNLKDRHAVPALIEVIERDPKPEVRLSAIRALGSMGDPSAVKILAKALKEEKMRREAVSALVRIGGKPALEALVEALQDEEAQLTVVQGLGEMADPAAKPHLVALYRTTKDDRVRGLASLALQRIRSIWGPTEAEMGLPIYPSSEFIPNSRAEWIFTTKDPLSKVTSFYKQRLRKSPMSFDAFRKKHEGAFGESQDGLPVNKPEVIFVVDEQLFQGHRYPSKLIFLRTTPKETEIQIFDALGEGN